MNICALRSIVDKIFFWTIDTGIQLTKTSAMTKCKTLDDSDIYICDSGELKCEKGECKCEPFGYGGHGHQNQKNVDDERPGHCKTTADCQSYLYRCLDTELICDKGECKCSRSFGHFGHEHEKAIGEGRLLKK